MSPVGFRAPSENFAWKSKKICKSIVILGRFLAAWCLFMASPPVSTTFTKAEGVQIFTHQLTLLNTSVSWCTSWNLVRASGSSQLNFCSLIKFAFDNCETIAMEWTDYQPRGNENFMETWLKVSAYFIWIVFIRYKLFVTNFVQNF